MEGHGKPTNFKTFVIETKSSKTSEGGKYFPKEAVKTKALVVPKPLIDLLNAADKNYEQRVHMDADGFLSNNNTYTYMVAEKVWPPKKKKDGTRESCEHFSYLLCTH